MSSPSSSCIGQSVTADDAAAGDVAAAAAGAEAAAAATAAAPLLPDLPEIVAGGAPSRTSPQ
jgi:hypothetical protein